MSKHSKREYSELCGINPDDFGIYKKRGKVSVGVDNMVDDTIEPNKTFLQHRKVLLQKKNKTDIVIDSQPVETIRKIKQKEPSADYGTLTESMQLDLEQKRYNVKKTKVELELKEIDKQKKMAALIPLDIVKPLMAALMHSTTTEFKNFMEEYWREIGKQYNIPAAQLADGKGQMVLGINKAVEKAIGTALKRVKIITDEFSETKRQGEHG